MDIDHIMAKAMFYAFMDDADEVDRTDALEGKPSFEDLLLNENETDLLAEDSCIPSAKPVEDFPDLYDLERDRFLEAAIQELANRWDDDD